MTHPIIEFQWFTRSGYNSLDLPPPHTPILNVIMCWEVAKVKFTSHDNKLKLTLNPKVISIGMNFLGWSRPLLCDLANGLGTISRHHL